MDIFVKPVIVFTKAFVKVHEEIKNVSVINKKYLSQIIIKNSTDSLDRINGQKLYEAMIKLVKNSRGLE